MLKQNRTIGIEVLEDRSLLSVSPVQLVDINEDPAESAIVRNLADVDGTLFFTADNGNEGSELWKSDGTVDGTVLVKDINPGASGSNPRYLTNVNGTLFFRTMIRPMGMSFGKVMGPWMERFWSRILILAHPATRGI